MIEVTIRNGSNSASKEYEEGTTLATITGDAGLMAFLGAGENVTALVNSEPIGSDTVLENGTTVYLERQAAAKA